MTTFGSTNPNFSTSSSHHEKLKVLQIVDNWDLNRISEKELTVVKKLASGGQGKVKLGKYYDMNVIIKVLHNLNARDYTNEVVNVFKYRHPNIPKFLGIFDSNKDFGVVLEHVDGMDLRKIINMEKSDKMKIPFLIKLDYLIQLAEVIHFLHDNHLIHRDLKPENIMIDHLGNMNLLDFGIAIPESQSEIDMDSHDFCLTPVYIPPEVVWQGQQINEDEDEEEESNISSQIKPSFNTTPSFGKQFSSHLSENSPNISPIKQTVNVTPMKIPKRKIIKISPKVDVWTFGIIMAELFTRCAPWANNEKAKPDDLYVNRSILLNKSYPVNKIYPLGHEFEQEIKSIIKLCTQHDESKRPDIKDIKFELLKVYQKEVISCMKDVRWQTMKNLNQMHQNMRQAFDKQNSANTRSIMRNNKMLYQRKNFSLEEINKVNLRLNIPTLGDVNLDQNTSDFKVIFSEHSKQLNFIGMKGDCKSATGSFEIENSLMEGLKKMNLQIGQKIKIMEHKKRELINKNDEFCEKFGRINIRKLTQANVNTTSVFKNYYFMTFDEFQHSIIICSYPSKEFKSVKLTTISSNLCYRNPFCLNYGEKLFLIGGLVTNTGVKNSNVSVQNNRASLVNFRKETYSELFGGNYIPTNLCFLYDPVKNEQRSLPYLLHPRNNHSCVVFKRSFLWVIGGETKTCEVLDIRNIGNTKFESCSFRTASDLVHEVYNPILFTYNDTFIIALEYENNEDDSFISYQMYDSFKWSKNKVSINLNLFNLKIDFLSGGYYSCDREDSLILFADKIISLDDYENISSDSEEEGEEDAKNDTPKENTNDIMKTANSLENVSKSKKPKNMKKSVFMNFGITVDYNLGENPLFNFYLESSSELNISTPQDNDETQNLIIHNSNSLYEYDEDFFFYSMNVKEKKVYLRTIKSEDNEFD